RAAIAHIGEQERFAAHKYVEGASRTGGCEGVEKSFGIVPIARAVFHPGDRVWISAQEALDQFWCDTDDRYRWNVVEIDFQTRIADALNHVAKVTVKTFVADVLVIKRRQHQHTCATVFYRMRSERDRLGDGAATGARHHAQRIDAGRDQGIEQRHSLCG